MKKDYKLYMLLFFAYIIWGTQVPLFKMITDDLPVGVINFLRFLITIIALLPFVLKKGEKVPDKKDLRDIMLLGLVGIFILGLFMIYGIKYSTSINSSILLNSNPLLIAILAPLMIKEKTNIKKTLGVVLGFCGIYIVMSNGFNFSSILNSEYLKGNLLLITSAFCIAFYNIYSKKYIQKYSGLTVVFYAVFSGTLAFFLYIIATKEIFQLANLTWTSFLILVHIAVFTTAFSWVMNFIAIGKLGAINAAAFSFLITISGVTFSALLLKEKLTIYILIGAILIISGIFIVEKS